MGDERKNPIPKLPRCDALGFRLLVRASRLCHFSSNPDDIDNQITAYQKYLRLELEPPSISMKNLKSYRSLPYDLISPVGLGS